jgi:hypothetical protein
LGTAFIRRKFPLKVDFPTTFLIALHAFAKAERVARTTDSAQTKLYSGEIPQKMGFWFFATAEFGEVTTAWEKGPMKFTLSHAVPNSKANRCKGNERESAKVGEPVNLLAG